MSVVAIIQARMGSTRLPGKVLMTLAGSPMVLRVAERTRRITGVDEVVVATSVLPSDDPLVDALAREGIPCFRGAEDDVLDRYYRCALEQRARAVVRITADCPLLSPAVSSRVVAAFLEGGCDYASNCHVRTYPRGLDTEVFSFAALEAAWREAVAQPDREHVTPFIWMHSDRFVQREVTDASANRSNLRWTVDEPTDYELVRRIYDAMPDRADFDYGDVLALLDQHPDWAMINSDVHQKHYGE